MKITYTENSFEVLGGYVQEELIVGQVVCEQGEEANDGRGDSQLKMDSFMCWNVRRLNCLRKKKDM